MMSNFTHTTFGFSIKALLEDPNLKNPPNLCIGLTDAKKQGKHDIISAFLGPNLWENPALRDNEDESGFDLEYMDLDEFLTENGIPVNLEDIDDTETISLLSNALAQSPSSSCQHDNLAQELGIGEPRPQHANIIHPMEPEIPLKKTCMPTTNSNHGLFLPDSPVKQQSVLPVSPNHIGSSLSQEPSAIERCLMDDDFGIKLPETTRRLRELPSNSKQLPDIDFRVSSSDLSFVSIPVYRQTSTTITQSDSSSDSNNSWSDSENVGQPESHQSSISHVSVPGQENFDPKNRRFTEDELKPQPIIKKSKKVFVKEHSKDDRYWHRRKKNNVAAKRSRDARRVKENQIAMRAAFLEQENDILKNKVTCLQNENEELCNRLAKYEKV